MSCLRETATLQLTVKFLPPNKKTKTPGDARRHFYLGGTPKYAGNFVRLNHDLDLLHRFATSLQSGAMTGERFGFR